VCALARYAAHASAALADIRSAGTIASCLATMQALAASRFSVKRLAFTARNLPLFSTRPALHNHQGAVLLASLQLDSATTHPATEP
jgi:hypothetical protein